MVRNMHEAVGSIELGSPLSAVAMISVGLNLFRHKNWARIIAVIFCIGALLTGVYVFFDARFSSKVLPVFLLLSVLYFSIVGFGLSYLIRPKVKEMFR